MTRERTIQLVEYGRRKLPKNALSKEEALCLHEVYGKQISVEWPTPKNNDQWELRPADSVGTIRVSPDLMVTIVPKVGLSNLFRMLEYAHDLAKFENKHLVNASSINDLFESLATILAERVLRRARRGFYRDYIGREEELPYVRGQVNVEEILRRPNRVVALPCRYEEHTADVEENQILAFTLQLVARSACLTPRTRPLVSRANRSLAGVATVQRVTGQACVNRLYHRLNDDYQPLHALCRFFLENCGPSHHQGHRGMVPFLVKMNLLFERFVAECLRRHLPEHLRFEAQEHVDVDEETGIRFHIDMVVYDRQRNLPIAVLDTKYKAPDVPSTSDIQQIVSYAAIKNCRHGFLVYPSRKTSHVKTRVGENFHVETLFIPLDGDPTQIGPELCDSFLSCLGDS